MKLRVLVLCSVLVIATVGLYLTISSDSTSHSPLANTDVSEPSTIGNPQNTRVENNTAAPVASPLTRLKQEGLNSAMPGDESNSDKTKLSTWKPLKSGVLTGIIVDEVLGPRWRAIIVEAKGTRFFVPHYIVKSANQSDAEYLSLLREYPGKVIGDLEVGTKVRVTYKERHNSDWKDADWSLDATRLVEIKSPK